jgi:hypothetical protein
MKHFPTPPAPVYFFNLASGDRTSLNVRLTNDGNVDFLGCHGRHFDLFHRYVGIAPDTIKKSESDLNASGTR